MHRSPDAERNRDQTGCENAGGATYRRFWMPCRLWQDRDVSERVDHCFVESGGSPPPR